MTDGRVDLQFNVGFYTNLRLFIHIETELMSVKVKKHSNSWARLDPSFWALLMNTPMHKPWALPVYVHTPAFIILAWNI